MTRIFTDGAEFGDVLFWDSYLAGTSATTSKKRSGNYSYDLQGNGGYASKYFTAVSEFYFRFGSYTGGSDKIVTWMKDANVLGSIGINNPTRKLEYFFGTTSTVLGTNAVDLNTWVLIEVYVKIADAGHITVKLNGVTEIDYSGDTKPAADSDVNILKFLGLGGNAWVDDLAMNDVAGGSDDSWCGDGHIEILTPMTGGTYAWTGSDGDSVDNYALIDDIPPNSDTDYVKSSTASQQDIYTLTDFTATGKIVSRIFAEVRAKDNDASGGQIKLGHKNDGTVYLCSSARTLSGAYKRIVGDDAKVNPFDSGIWEDADLDAIQLVIECE